MPDYYIGLMSGTSMDAIDAALIECNNESTKLIAHHSQPLSKQIQNRINELCIGCDNELQKILALDIELGKQFADCANALLKENNLKPTDIKAIGSHGQTIRHYPEPSIQNSLQIADPNTIAELTGITTVADFRRRDMASGGQGAPLVPAFHSQIFKHATQNTVVLNIGGIANITVLPCNNSAGESAKVIGFDTGPGNGLLDAWIQTHKLRNYDNKGEWAASGSSQTSLLQLFLDEPYFKLAAPKSTGRELFNIDWLNKKLDQADVKHSHEDIQATLCELTAISIADAINNLEHTINRILVCGGGARNDFLMSRIQANLVNIDVTTTEVESIAPEWIEAMAFAWLAKQTLAKQPGNITSVTGASHVSVLGGIYYA